MLRAVLAAELIGTALDVATPSSSAFAPAAAGAILVALAVAILVGLWTEVAASGAVLGVSLSFAAAISRSSASDLPLHTLGYAIALWLTGPGAYAADARRHGRREIVVPRRRPPSE